MNGSAVGDDYFNPGLTHTTSTIMQTYDVAEFGNRAKRREAILGEGSGAALSPMGYLEPVWRLPVALLTGHHYADRTEETGNRSQHVVLLQRWADNLQ